MYDLENLHKRDKRVVTKSQKIFGANSYVCRSYRGKFGRWGLLAPLIMNRVKVKLKTVFHHQQQLVLLVTKLFY